MADGDLLTILLVEDEPQIRRLLRTALAAYGYRLIEAPTGEDGLLRVYMVQLRRKLEADVARPRYLLTEPRVGYRLAAE